MITKQKMAALLASGLNPAITSRAELASSLNVAQSTVGKWFATTDSQGVVRDPVVPQRHTTRIVELFSIDPGRLSLPDSDFEVYCYQEALARKRGVEKDPVPTPDTNISVQPNIMTRWRKSPIVIGATGCLLVGALITFFVVTFNKETNPLTALTVAEYRAIFSQQAEETKIALELAQDNPELQALLASQLEKIEARIKNAEVYLGEYQQGLNEQREALTLFSDTLPANQLVEIRQALASGDVLSASDALNAVIDQVENDMGVAGQAAYLLGNQAALNLQMLTAIKYYQQAIEFDNDNVAYRIDLSRVYYEIGDYKNSEKVLFQLAEVSGRPELQEEFVHSPHAFAEFLSKEFMPGVEHMELRSQALERLGIIRIYQSRQQQASQYFNASLAEIDKELAPSLYIKRKTYLDVSNGWLKAYERDFQGAYDLFASVVNSEVGTSKPKEMVGSAMLGLARCNQQLGYPEKANEMGLQALEFNQSNFHSHHRLVRMSYYYLSLNYNSQGNAVEAEKYYHLVLSTSGSVENQNDLLVIHTLNGLGFSELNKGNLGASLKYFNQAEFLNSGAEDNHRRVKMGSYLGQGWVFLLQGDPNAALTAFGQARSVSDNMLERLPPSEAALYFAQGRTHQVMEQYQIAAQKYRQSLIILETIPALERARNPSQLFNALQLYASANQQAVSVPSQYSILQWMDGKSNRPLMPNWLLLGDMYLSLSDYEAARDAYQRGALVEEGYEEDMPVYRVASLLGLANTAYLENNHSLANQRLMEASAFADEHLDAEHQLTIATKNAIDVFKKSSTVAAE